MRLEPLYGVEFSYPEHYHVEGVDSLHAFFGEGRTSGFLTGRFRGMNHTRRRVDDVYLPDYQGVIETDDGATVWFDYRGYGRPRERLADGVERERAVADVDGGQAGAVDRHRVAGVRRSCGLGRADDEPHALGRAVRLGDDAALADQAGEHTLKASGPMQTSFL